MKLLILFGSSSDAHVYDALCTHLQDEGFLVDFAVLSAHRNPTELEAKLAEGGFDAVIAGAGISAHLPGVVASKVQKPVFGIPVASQFGGLDSVMSIQMMPKGVPVLSCGTNTYTLFAPFLKAAQNHTWNREIYVVATEEARCSASYQKEFSRLAEAAQERGIQLIETTETSPVLPSIVFVHNKTEIPSSPLSIAVPLLESSARALPQTAMTCFEWTQTGGLWVGVNNATNALIFFTLVFGALS